MRINKIEKIIININKELDSAYHNNSYKHHSYKNNRKNNEINILANYLNKRVQAKYGDDLVDPAKFEGDVYKICKSALCKINIQDYIQLNIGHMRNLINYKFKDIQLNKKLRYKLDFIVGKKYLSKYDINSKLISIIHGLKVFDNIVNWVDSVKNKRHYDNPFCD